MGFSTRLVPRADAAAWDRALDGLPHAIAHTARYQRDDAFLFVAEGPRGRAVCPLVTRARGTARDVYTPYGFSGFTGVGELDGLYEAWLASGRTEGWVAGYAMLHPVLGVDLPSTPLTESYVLSLEGDLLARMSSRRRAKLRKDQTPIVDDRDENTSRFLDLYPAHAERVGAAAVYHFSRERLLAWCHHPEVLLVGARGASGEVDAVAMFGAGTCAEYMLLARTADAVALAEPLLYAGFLRLRERGHTVVNLGGGIRPHDGVAEFKRRFGATPTPVRAVRTVFDAAAYADLCAAANVDPGAPGYFPAYRRAA